MGGEAVGKGLTKRQREILTYVMSNMQQRGYPPSVREIGTALGLTSSSTVHSHLTAICIKDLIPLCWTTRWNHRVLVYSVVL